MGPAALKTDASADNDMPTSNSLSSDPESLRLLPDTSDSKIQVDTLGDPALDTCSLMTNISSVERFHSALEEAKNEAQIYLDINSELLSDPAESQKQARDEIALLRAQHEAPLVDKKQLKASLNELNATLKDIMAHSLA